MLPRTETLAQPHQHEQRANSPRNPEHGQEAAQLVSQNGAADLPESVRKCLHGYWTPREGAWRVIRDSQALGSRIGVVPCLSLFQRRALYQGMTSVVPKSAGN